MPRLAHEALVQLIRRAPELVPALMWPEGQPLSCAGVHVTAAEFVDLNFAEYRADGVLALGEDPRRPELVVVVEVQLEPDPEKRKTWPLYLAGARTRLDCPAILVVIAPDRRVARWAAEPIDLGGGRCILHPWVLGPDDIPLIDDLEHARAAPELAVLSVAAHADDPGVEHVALAALEAVHDLDGERKILYPDLVLGLLSLHARIALEKLMPTAERRFVSDIAQNWYEKGLEKGEEQGEAKGKAELLLRLLALKGFALTDAERERVHGCTDHALLDTWAARILTATSLSDVLGPV